MLLGPTCNDRCRLRSLSVSRVSIVLLNQISSARRKFGSHHAEWVSLANLECKGPRVFHEAVFQNPTIPARHAEGFGPLLLGLLSAPRIEVGPCNGFGLDSVACRCKAGHEPFLADPSSYICTPFSYASNVVRVGKVLNANTGSSFAF